MRRLWGPSLSSLLSEAFEVMRTLLVLLFFECMKIILFRLMSSTYKNCAVLNLGVAVSFSFWIAVQKSSSGFVFSDREDSCLCLEKWNIHVSPLLYLTELGNVVLTDSQTLGRKIKVRHRVARWLVNKEGIFFVDSKECGAFWLEDKQLHY